MKNLLITIFAACGIVLNSNAQIVVTASNYNAFFNSGNNQITDTAPAISAGSAGANIIWNLSGLHSHLTKSNSFMAPPSGLLGSSFPGSDVCMKQDTNYYYYDTSASALTYWGFAGNILGINTNSAVVNDNPETILTFPSSYSSSFTDNSDYDRYFEYNAIYEGYFVDSIRIKNSTTVNSVIDGWGTVTTPNATVPCLRQNILKHSVDTTWAKVFIGGYHYWIELYNDTSNTQSYSFISNWGGGLIATIEYYSDSNAIAEARWNPLTIPVISVLLQTNVSCNGGNNGNVTVSITGGTSPYAYTWSAPGGQTGATATGLSAGTYYVTVVDAVNSSDTATIVISEPSALSASISSPTNVSCYGGATGIATVSPSGGTSPYSYLWSAPGAQTGQTATGLSAATYNVTVTDAKGCTKTTSTFITEPPALTASISSQTNLICYSGNNGTATVTPGGGTTGYTFIWSSPGGQTGQMATGLSAGTYTVTVTDAKSCTKTASTSITQPTQLLVDISSQTNVSCNSCNDGTITVGGLGGTSPYSYNWSNSQSTSTATGLAPGNYSVTITDAGSCTANSTITIDSLMVINAADYSFFTYGKELITDTLPVVSPGTAGANVTWNLSGLNSHLFSGNSFIAPSLGVKGTSYPMTNVCMHQDSLYYYFDSTTAEIDLWGVAGNLLGNSVDNAQIYSNPSTYLTFPTTFNTSFTDTASYDNYFEYNDMYQGVFVDSLREKETLITSSKIDGWGKIITPNDTFPGLRQNVTRHSIDSTWAKIFVGGYHYWISIYNDTSNIQFYNYISNISGNTIATLEFYADSNAIVEAKWNPITLPKVSVASQTNVSCFGLSNGSANSTITGGKTPYSYSWNTLPVQTTANATGLAAGTYTLTVIDSIKNQSSTTVTITQPASALTATITAANNASCGVQNGNTTVTAGGGTSGYSYLWNTNPSQLTASATGLSAGSYTVTVSDANGCTNTATANISNNNAAIVNIDSQINVDCNGLANGSATASATGGTGTLTYDWSTTPVQHSLTATGLMAGTYSISATDTVGCVATKSVTISEPTVLTATITSQTNPDCFGNMDGDATVTAGGGTTNYTYIWSTNPIQTNSTVTGLSAGTITVTVTDGNGCTKNATTTITEPPFLSASAASTDVLCNGENSGKVTATVTGGTSPYNYLWNNSQTSNPATGLAANTYSVTVTDAKLCTITASAIVSQPSILAASSTSTDVACNGGVTGSSAIVATGGISPYSYLWSNTQTTNPATGLAANTYSVTVTDANLCTATASAIVTEPSVLSASANSTNVACNGGNTGSADAVATGGISPYSYLWSNTQTANPATGLAANTYIVTVTDANLCTATASVIVSEPSVLSASATSTNVACNGGNTGSAATVVNGGISPYSYLWSNSQITNPATGLVANTYTVTVTDANLCSATANAIISEPSALSASATSTDVACNGGSSGSVTASVSGGTSPYSYLWSDPDAQIINPATGLVANSYSVTITDNNLCSTTATAAVGEPTALGSATTTTNVACNGENNGSATVSVSGGTLPYTYVWSDSQITSPATGLEANTYFVTVTDANLCAILDSADVSEPFVLSVSATVSGDVSCFGGNDGSTLASVSGGTTGYTYQWSNGSPNPDAGMLTAGSYTVTVTDANGCNATGSATVSEPTALSATIIVTTDDSTGTGSATVTASGGTSSYSYLWNNGQTGQTATGLLPGIYSVTVTDANGCDFSTSDTVVYVGLNNSEMNDFSIRAFPNPSNGIFNLEVISKTNMNTIINVLDAKGQVVNKRNLIVNQGKNNLFISLEYNNNGIYFFEIITKEGIVHVPVTLIR